MAEEETYDQGLRVLSDQELKKLLNSVDDEVREKQIFDELARRSAHSQD